VAASRRERRSARTTAEAGAPQTNAGYADLGIGGTMPSSGLCRVNLYSFNDNLE
jgi:hypothetical protein